MDYLSPVSTPDVTPGEESTTPQVLEISSNLNGIATSDFFLSIHRLCMKLFNSVSSVFILQTIINF